MIKAQDLRIGNLVDYECTTHIVTGIMGRSICSRWPKQSDTEDDYVDLDENYKPIPLTPEILLKAGFECTYNSKYKQSYDHKENGEFGVNFHCVGSMYDAQGRTFIRYFSENVRKPIKYLHELQNSFYTLTGEELSITLTAPGELTENKK